MNVSSQPSHPPAHGPASSPSSPGGASAAAGVFPVGGLGLGSFTSGKIELSLPLVAGTHKVDLGNKERAELKVETGTEIKLGATVGTGLRGPRLADVNLQITKPLTLKNPSSLKHFPLGDVVDALADVEISGLKVDANGNLSPQGRTEVLIIHEPLAKAVKPELLPRLLLDLEDIVAGKLYLPPAKASKHAADHPIKGSELLRQLAPMIGKGNYTLHLAGNHSALTLGPGLVTVQGNGPRDLVVKVSGTLDLDASGRLVFTAKADVQTQVADSSVQADGQLGLDFAEMPDLMLKVQGKLDLKTAELVHSASGVKVAIDGTRSLQEFSALADLRLRGGQLKASGKAQVNVRASVDLPRLAAGGVDFSGQLTADLNASSDFSVDPNGLQAAPQVRIEPVGGQVRLRAGGIELPASLIAQGSVITGKMNVLAQGGRFTIRDCVPDLRLALEVQAPPVNVFGGQLSFAGRSLVAGKARLGLESGKGLVLDDGQLRLEASLKEGKLDAAGLHLHVAEGSSVSADLQKLHAGLDGVRFADPTLGFDLLLAASEFRLGGVRLMLDGPLPSRLSGSAPLRIENGRPGLPQAGEAGVQFQLSGKSLGGDLPGGAFQGGAGAKDFTGTAKLRFTPQQVDVLDGRLEARVDLAGSAIRLS